MIAAAVAMFLLCAATVLHSRPTRVGVMFADLGFRFVVEWCIVVLVWTSLLRGRSRIGKMLNCRTLVVLGTMSYSLYLWQQPFLGPIQPFWMFKLPGNLIVVFILASASCYFVEQPFLRLKTVFKPTPDAKDRSRLENQILIAYGSAI